MAKFIRFDKDTEYEEFNGHTVYKIVNKRMNLTIGQVFWYPTWKKFVATFQEGSIWSDDCLRDVAAFCEKEAK